MASWNDDDSSDEDICMVSMDSQLFETPNIVVDPSFYGSFTESEPTCMMHQQRPKKMVAFEGTLTGRRFLGCPVQQNLGRVKDKQAHEKEVGKLKKEIDFLSNSYNQLVEDVSKLFDYQDSKMSHDMEYTSQAINDLNKNKKELEDHAKIEISMEKLKLAKEQRCILQSQAGIIQNMRKTMKKVHGDMDLLKEEKKKLEYLIADLLKAGHGSKDKLERIKAIMDE
ncbi:chloride channel-like protein clc-g [Hordeum vulgare]|nr:chloride channel-like protein clc-g [Hordeum vulgare]